MTISFVKLISTHTPQVPCLSVRINDGAPFPSYRGLKCSSTSLRLLLSRGHILRHQRLLFNGTVNRSAKVCLA